MQTFLTYDSYEETAKSLDKSRLNKQVVENFQIAKTILGIKLRQETVSEVYGLNMITEQLLNFAIIRRQILSGEPILNINKETFEAIKQRHGWENHPAVRSWEHHLEDHLVYSYFIAKEAAKRGYDGKVFLSHYRLVNSLVEHGKNQFNFKYLRTQKLYIAVCTAICEDEATSKQDFLPEVFEQFGEEIRANSLKTTAPWDFEKITSTVIKTHRAMLYIKDPRYYSQWAKWKSYAYAFPAKGSDVGYFWPSKWSE